MHSELSLLVVRHGETDWNRQSRIQGCLDTHLSDAGRQQIERLGHCLKHHSFDALYSSDLQRAAETAAAIAQHHNKSVQTDIRLRERNFGAFQGMSVEEVQLQHPKWYQRHRDLDPHFNYCDGQSRTDKYEEVRSFFEDIQERHRTQNVLAVSHGGSISLMVHHVLGIPLDQDVPVRCGNAEYCVFELEAGRWILRLWGQNQHLIY